MPSFGGIAKAAGAKFNLFMAPGAPAWAEASLGYATTPAKATGLVESLEGVNEPDTAYSTSNGNSPSVAAKFQEKVQAAAQGIKVLALASAYGAGWDKPGGTYGQVGDLSKSCESGNFHATPPATRQRRTCCAPGWAGPRSRPRPATSS